MVENCQEAVVEAGSGGEGRECDDEGAFGDIGGAGPALSDGEQDGAPDILLERFGGGAEGLAEGGAETGGEAAEGIGELRGEGRNVVEGEDAVVAGEGEEVADGGRDGGEGSGAGIDHGAEDAGGEGFAGAGGTLEDEEGEGSVGAESGQEPGKAAKPGGAGREIEAGAEDFQSRGQARQSASGIGAGGQGSFRGGHGFGEGVGGAGDLEENGGAGGGLPASGRDFDKLFFGVGEVEEDLVGEAVGAKASDAAKDREALAGVVEVGLGFEVIEDGVESAGGRQGAEFGVAFVEEPVAKGAGADGKDVAASGGVDGEADECRAPCNGVAVAGGEGFAASEEGDQVGEWFGLHQFLSIPG